MLAWQLYFDDVYGGYLQNQRMRDRFLKIFRLGVFRDPDSREAALKYHYH
jgi:hypothetical protein